MKSVPKVVTAVIGSISCAALLFLGSYFYEKRFRKYLCRLKRKTVIVCRSVSDFANVEDTFYNLCFRRKVMGLDCEWVTLNGKRQKVSLLQLAPSSDFCVLLRESFLESRDIPSSLKTILRDEQIIKVGVAIHDDALKLLQDHNLIVRGCLDLRHIITQFTELSGVPVGGLQALSSHLLAVRPEKSWRIRCSDWAADNLTQKQINYAAEDALLSVQIFDQMVRLRLSLTRFRPCWFERLTSSTIEMCRVAVDVPFRTRTRLPRSPEKHGEPHHTVSSRKLGIFRSYRIRKTPLYDNCVLQAPDGEPLCTCDYKKARWYLEKGLGTEVSEEPLIVRLNFEPANRPILDSQYYIQAKDNVCVVCGSKESLLRKNVVPREYRKNFPDVMKHHISHDILLLCVQCHQLSNLRDLDLRYVLASECDAPFESHEVTKCREDPVLRRIKSAARALLRSRDRLPSDRVAALEQVLNDHYNSDSVTKELVEEAAEIDTKIYNTNFVAHGVKVVEHYKRNGGLISFETKWRKHFLETMKPKYMPALWSVDHHHELLAIKIAKGKGKDTNLDEIGITQEYVRKALEKVGAQWLLDDDAESAGDHTDSDNVDD
ncbi:exonuclease 3'-5' domain-containing protein 2-like [Ornithodoros turicata]|uniref:exonuclease 3'-5' domain-containing protein 2-like n=1 Tax=Ornithodoros turicata TaxID=34597 RepID=UPI003138E0E7